VKQLDRIIQRIRIKKALSYIPTNSSVLDIGSGNDGALFELAERKISYGIGLDPCLITHIKKNKYQLFPGVFPDNLPKSEKFDVITMLAVFEHMPPNTQKEIANIIPSYLETNGKLILTIPSVFTDKILELLKYMKLIDGIALDEHHGFNPTEVIRIFSGTKLVLEVDKFFEFGLNRLFVFRKL